MVQRILVRGQGESSLRAQQYEDLEAHLEAGAFVWLDIAQRDPDELDELGERFGFDPAAIEDVLDVEQLPKFDSYGDHLFVVLHALTTAEDRLDTHEVDCFLQPNLLVTVRTERIAGLEWLWNAVQAHPHMAEHGSDELFAQLAEVIGRRYIEVIDAVETRADALADDALSAEPNVLAEVQLLKREEATIRRVLRPQRLVIGALRSNTAGFFTGDSLKLLTDAYDVHNLVVESLESTRGLLTDTLDTYRGAAAERQAHAATMLTVYAAILLPLTLITGWYGMNVSNLPGSQAKWGWLIVTGLMMLFAVVSWLIFVKVGMIRKPRMVTSTRLVSGLAEVARAPVKPFTMLRRSTRPGAAKRPRRVPAARSGELSGHDGDRGTQGY